MASRFRNLLYLGQAGFVAFGASICLGGSIELGMLMELEVSLETIHI